MHSMLWGGYRPCSTVCSIVHALRKLNPHFAQVIHGLSGQRMDIADPRFAQDNPQMVPVHGLTKRTDSQEMVGQPEQSI